MEIPPLDDMDFWEDWEGACRFFQYDDMKDGEGVLLDGCTERIPPASMVRIYCSLTEGRMSDGKRDARYRLSPSEQIQLMGVVARCWSVFSRCSAARHTENTSSLDGPSIPRLDHEQCLLCTCQERSLTMRICENTIRGPQVILACNRASAERYINIAKSTFGHAEMVTPPWMTTAMYDGGSLDHRPPCSGLDIGTIRAQALVATLKGARPDYGLVGDGMSLAEVRTRSKIHPVLAPLTVPTSGPSYATYTQERVIMVVNCEGFTIEAFDRLFTSWGLFGRTTGQGRRRVKVKGALAATTICCDALMEAKGDIGHDLIRLLLNVCHLGKDGSRGTLMSESVREILDG